MEPASLALGVVSLVGLYSACIDAVDRVTSYRNFGSDRKQLLTQIDANKDIFQKWAKRVGISPEGLLDPHDIRLEDPNTAKAIIQILSCIRDLFGDLSHANDRLYHNGHQNTQFVPKRLYEPNVPGEPQAPLRRRDKLAWTFHGKNKSESQVLRFSGLVATLDRLVPPHGSFNGEGLNHQLHSINIKGSLPQTVSLSKDMKILKTL